MPVGNDVVDLADPACQPGALHPRFDTRAFTPRERALLDVSAQAHTLRWTLWAAKESTFKACRKVDAAVRFIPRNFTVNLLPQTPEQRAHVVHPVGTFNVWLDCSNERVHALASQSRTRPRFQVAGDAFAPPKDQVSPPSQRARQLARAALSKFLSVSINDLDIVTGKDRVPRIKVLGAPAPIDLSLSHDGRFVAWAWELSGETPLETQD